MTTIVEDALRWARRPPLRIWVVGAEVEPTSTRCIFCKATVPDWAAVLHPISCYDRPTHLKANWRRDYDARMRHPSWGAKKDEFRAWWTARYGVYRCALPGCDDERVTVHHVTYINLGAEPMTDLLPLCGHHHNDLHAR